MTLTFHPHPDVLGTDGPPAPSSAPCQVRTLLEYREGRWCPFTWDRCFAMTLAQLLSGEVRLLIQLQIEGAPCYLCTHDADADALQKKYPHRKRVHIRQLWNFLKRSATDPAWTELLPQIFIWLSQFEGSHLVK